MASQRRMFFCTRLKSGVNDIINTGIYPGGAPAPTDPQARKQPTPDNGQKSFVHFVFFVVK